MSTSFHSIASCSFDLILMSESSLQECYMMLNCCLLSELGDLSFSLHFVCASYELDVYMSFEVHHVIFTVVSSMYFCESCSECIEVVK